MKRGEAERAAEYPFDRFLRRSGEVVKAHGGTAAGDGMACLFADVLPAVRAALRLQTGMDAFITKYNRIQRPFRIRCGPSAGEVALGPETSIGRIQSQVVDRAASMHKQAEPGGIVVSAEVAEVARRELGGLEPLGSPASGEAAYAWLDRES